MRRSHREKKKMFWRWPAVQIMNEYYLSENCKVWIVLKPTDKIYMRTHGSLHPTWTSCVELSSGSGPSPVPSLGPCGWGEVFPRPQGSMSGPLSPSFWMSGVRLTDIFPWERERVGDGEGVGCRTQELLNGETKQKHKHARNCVCLG